MHNILGINVSTIENYKTGESGTLVVTAGAQAEFFFRSVYSLEVFAPL